MFSGLDTNFDALNASLHERGLDLCDHVLEDEVVPLQDLPGEMNGEDHPCVHGESWGQHYSRSHQERSGMARPIEHLDMPLYLEPRIPLHINHINHDSWAVTPAKHFSHPLPPFLDDPAIEPHVHHGTVFVPDFKSPYVQEFSAMQAEHSSVQPFNFVRNPLFSTALQPPQPSFAPLQEMDQPVDFGQYSPITMPFPTHPPTYFGSNPFHSYHRVGHYSSGSSGSSTSSSFSDASAGSNMSLLEPPPSMSPMNPTPSFSAQSSGAFHEITVCPHNHHVTFLAHTSTQTTSEHVFRLPSKQTMNRRRLPVCEPDNWRGGKAQEYGSLWDHSYTCRWPGCNTEHPRMDALNGDKFIENVHEHLLSHTKSSPEETPWSCKWDGCADRGKFELYKTRLRHLHLHIPWYFVCLTCHQMRGRKDLKKKTCACPAP